MTKQMTKKQFPFQSYIPKPSAMTVSQQICCMVWLSNNYSLEELRERQDFIGKQIVVAHFHNCGGKSVANLFAMQANTEAAVAYQSFDDIY